MYIYIGHKHSFRTGNKIKNPPHGSCYLSWVFLEVSLGGMWRPKEKPWVKCWLAEIKGKFRSTRDLVHVSRGSTSGVFCSITCSHTTFLNFQGLSLYSFLSNSPSMTLFISAAQRHCAPLNLPHTSPKQTPACCTLTKQMRATTNHFKLLFEWEIMGNAILLLSPHSCNTDEHHIGDISARGKCYCDGLHTAQNKEHTFVFRLGITWEKYLDSEPKQSMILYKPVIEKSIFSPRSKAVSYERFKLEFLKDLNFQADLKYFFNCMYIYRPNSCLKYFDPASLLSRSPTLFTSQHLCVGSVTDSSQAKIISVKALPKSGRGEWFSMHMFKSSPCRYPPERKPRFVKGFTHWLHSPFSKS